MSAETTGGGDPVLDALLPIARDVFGALNEDDGGRLEHLPPHVQRGVLPLLVAAEHPVRPDFVAALASDDQLRAFPDAGEGGLFLWTSTGHGWRLQTEQLAGALSSSAIDSLVAKGGATDTVEALLEEVGETLRAFRLLLAGEIIEVPAATAYEGFALPDGVRVPTPWGELRQATPVEESLQPFGEVAPRVVLESRLPVRLSVGEERPPNISNAALDQALERLGEAGGLLVLALLLAIDGDEFAIADAVWRTTVIPGQLGRSFTGRLPPARLFPRFAHEPLSTEEVGRFRTWTELVGERYHRSIEIAVSRTLSSVRERAAVEDALIDAVVAWENLVGAGGHTEVVFRVTTALAGLLEQDPAKRDEFRKRLARVYTIRSKLLHGEEIKSSDKIEEKKETAIEVAVDALRTLFTDMPHLLSNRERGMLLILGAASPRD